MVCFSLCLISSFFFSTVLFIFFSTLIIILSSVSLYLSLLPPQIFLPLYLLHIFVCNSLTFRAGQKCRRGNLTFWTGQRAEAAAVVTSLVACLECLLLLLLCLVINWLSSWLDQAKWQRLIYCAYAPWSMAGSTHKFRAAATAAEAAAKGSWCHSRQANRRWLQPIVLRGVRHIISVSVTVVCLPYQEAANCIFMAHKYCIMAHSWPSESVSSLSKCVGSIWTGRYPVK